MSAAPVLALSASNATGDMPWSVALDCGGRRHTADGAAGGGDLASGVAAVCCVAGLAPSGIGALRLDVGPGSYTGLRVAVTFARFLAAFTGIEARAVSTLALLAARVRGADARRLVPLLDARRGRWHSAAYVVGAGGLIAAVEPPAALSGEDTLARIGRGDVIVAPAALQTALPAAFVARLAAVQARAIGVDRLVAAELLDDGLPFRAARPEELEPHYLMASYAEG